MKINTEINEAVLKQELEETARNHITAKAHDMLNKRLQYLFASKNNREAIRAENAKRAKLGYGDFIPDSDIGYVYDQIEQYITEYLMSDELNKQIKAVIKHRLDASVERAAIALLDRKTRKIAAQVKDENDA